MTEFTVTGIRYQMGEHLSYEEKDAAAKRFVASLRIGQQVLLVFEPDNPGSPNKAIAVYIDYERIGYIADEQCDLVHPLLNERHRGKGTIVRKDNHVTFFIAIPGASENQKVITPRERVLPNSPLGDSFRMPFTKDENALQLIASTLSETEVNMDNLPEIMQLTKRYVPLAKISICHEDNLWRSSILRKLEHLLDYRQQLGMSADDTKEMEVYCKQVRDAVGDMHRSAEHWPEKVFINHLETLRKNESVSRYLYKKYCETFLNGKDFAEADKNKIASEYDRLYGWMKGLKWSELKNPKNLQAMGFRVNYLGLSRQELYDLYSVLLLIEKLESLLFTKSQRICGPDQKIPTKMKIPFKPYKATDADIFTVDAIHQKYWKDFCDVCYPHFGFENEEDSERSYEQKYDTFRQCHNMLKEYFDWNEELMFKVSEEDLKRFKNAYSLFATLSTKDNATLPMLLVLLRMQQSIWNRLREDRRMMDYVYPRKYFLTYDNYEKYEMGSYEDLPSDEHIMANIGDLEKRICDDLLNERKWDDGWVREIEEFCCHHTDFEENDKIEWDVTVGELVQKLSGHVLRSFNYALHESFTKFECNVAKGSGDVVKAVVYRLFMTYQSSLPEVKTIFDDYPAHLCMSKMIQTREELINEFKQTKLGAHWFECIMLPEGLEKVGKYLINHRDTISVDEESHFFYLLDEICIMTDILQGNISKYWLNVEFEDEESVQRQDKELKNNPHKVNPVVDAIKEQTDQDNPPSPLNSISPFTPAVIDTTKAEAVIALLRQLMKGKIKPKDVLMPVRAAMEAGVIRRPTWEEFCQEFGSYRLKSKTSFSDYTNPEKSPYIGADFGMMKEKFRQLMSEGQ